MVSLRSGNSSVSEEELKGALAEIFGYRSFRPYQEEIIRAIISGRDAFAVMPTGGGKSLCYQLPATLLDGACVVVSPLLSLMKDQVDAAVKNGINAATINSTTSMEDWKSTMRSLDRGQIDLLYVSPERFNTGSFARNLQNVPLSFFAIDEAHCISQWGHYFRPDYVELGQISELFPDCPIAAFTATATEIVADDIISCLKLRDPLRVRASFDRPNLFYQIEYKEDLDAQLTDFLKTVQGESGIVYRSTRKKVEQTAETLVRRGFKAAAYHAGMTDAERARVQDAFLNDETPIIVATVAFGMGIDKSNVRFVVHADMPKDVEGYYQETGRAGRDGAPARCYMLYGYQDVAVQRYFAEDCEDEVERESALKRLNEMVKFAESDGCRRANLLRYFGETYRPAGAEPGEDGSGPTNCGACDYCVGAAPRVDATIEAQKALSAMERTGNRYGSGHIIDVLTGKETERVLTLGHNRLKTFGVGADHTRTYWKYLIQALLTQGIARLSGSEYPVPQVSAAGWEVMRGQRKVEILKRPEGKAKKERAKRAATAGSVYEKENLSAKDRRLFDVLRALRYEIAKDENVPPYVVFSDKSLVDMALLRPKTDDEFLLVQGVGSSKLKKYGKTFMAKIAEFEAEG